MNSKSVRPFSSAPSHARWRARTALAFTCGALAVIAGATAFASIMAQVDLDTLARRADLIVRARAESTQSAWASDHKQIRTVTRLTVQSAIKGSAPAAVDVVTPGGTVGDISQVVHGSAQFAAGEDVVVLLEKLPAAPLFRVSGMALGKFTVVEDEQGERQVVQDRAGLSFAAPDGHIAPAPAFAPMREADFLEHLRRALQGKGQP